MPTVEQDLKYAHEFLASGAVPPNGTAPEEDIHLDIPPFPLDALPPFLADFVERTARTYPVPAEMVGMPLLVIAGSLIGNRVALKLKESWHEYPCMWLVIIAGSGKLKSPPLRMAHHGINELQRVEDERYEFALASYEREMVRRKTEKGYQGEEPDKPKLRSYFTTDITMESLASELKSTPGLFISSDEIAGWVERLNQYRKGGDRQHYMSIHSGHSIRVNRKSAAGPTFIERPVVNVAGTIQPSVVPSLKGESKHKDGFVYRMLPMVPNLPPKLWNDYDISKEDKDALAGFFYDLDQIPFGDPEGENAVTFSPEALDVWRDWDNENNTDAHGRDDVIGGFYMKLEAYCARIALVLHVCRYPDLSVRVMAADTMRDAIAITEWFRPQIHWFAQQLEMADRATKKANQVGEWDLLVRHYRKLAQCHTVTLSHDKEKCDGFVPVRDLCRKTHMSREVFDSITKKKSDYVTLRLRQTGGNPSQEVKIETVTENADMGQCDSGTVATDSNAPPF